MLHRTRPFPGAGVAAGAVGGLVAAWVKFGWDVTWVPRAAGRIPEPMVLVSMFTHMPTPVWVSYVVHFAFSIFCGVAYGALVEFFPIVAIAAGIGFGLMLWLGVHEIVMPLIGLTPPIWNLPANEQGSEFFGYALWGFVIGVFYHDLRARFVGANPSIVAGATIVTAPMPEAIAVYFK